MVEGSHSQRERTKPLIHIKPRIAVWFFQRHGDQLVQGPLYVPSDGWREALYFPSPNEL